MGEARGMLEISRSVERERRGGGEGTVIWIVGSHRRVSRLNLVCWERSCFISCCCFCVHCNWCCSTSFLFCRAKASAVGAEEAGSLGTSDEACWRFACAASSQTWRV